MKIDIKMEGEFRKFLSDNGFIFEKRPNQIFLARGGGVVVNLYKNGSVVVAGSNSSSIARIESWVRLHSNQKGMMKLPTSSNSPFNENRIGMDEAGKGDYFGPLVAAAVAVTPNQDKELRQIGVKDTKLISVEATKSLADKIVNEVLAKGQYEVVCIMPKKYNQLMESFKNLNGLLGWAHARALEEVLNGPIECNLAIADQFGNRKYIEGALFERGKKIQLIQMPKAEKEMAVAAAAILARARFLNEMENIGLKWNFNPPRGASHVEEMAKSFVAAHGVMALLEVAKVHFATTARVVDDTSYLYTKT